MTIVGGSIMGLAVHTNMSILGKTFSYLFQSQDKPEKERRRREKGDKKETERERDL